MSEDVINKEKDVSELTAEERAAAWMGYVKAEVNTALDIFLEKSKIGNIGISYMPHVVERLDTGDELDEDRADGVVITVVLEFEEPLDRTKPRIPDEEVEPTPESE